MAKLKTKKMTVWTMGYFPFIMGGNVWQPLGAEMDVEGPYDLGRGYQGYLARGPNGETAVVEAQSGGIVGPTVQAVRRDIKNADPAVMEQQIVEAIERRRNIYAMVDADELWRRMAKGGRE